MRDNHEGMPEFINAFEDDSNYFLRVKVTLGSESKSYQFGVSRSGYLATKRMFQSRPFDMMPGLKYRYFYAGSSKIWESQLHEMTVRIEQGKDATSMVFEVPKDLHANLLWFKRLESFTEASYLEVTEA